MLHWLKRSRLEISRAAPGKLRVWVDLDDNTIKTKDENAVIKTLGNGIKSIVKTATNVLVDTYTITRDDDETQTYDVTNGRGIDALDKVSTNVLTDTYRISFNDETTFDYNVLNGRGINDLEKLETQVLADVYRVTFNDGTVFDYTVTNGRGIVEIQAPATFGQPDTTDAYTVLYNDGTTSGFAVRNGRDGIDGLITSINGISEPNVVLTAQDVGAIPADALGITVATLDGSGKVPAAQLPSYVDDVLEFANLAAFPVMGESGKIYVAIDTGFTYRWSGSQYVVISANQNAFAAITGNTGTATADTVSDTISITGTNGISTSATDTPDGVVITPQYAAPVTIGTANSEGAANTFARSNHVHAHGDQAGGTLHAAATTSVNGFMSAADKTKLDGIQSGAQVNAVTSVFGRTGAVVAQQADYDAFFTTPAEAAAAAPVQSVNGQTGAVNIAIPAPKLSANITTLFASPANSTAVTVVLSLAIPANYLTTGKSFDFDLEGTQSQSAAATNVVGAIFVNGTQLVSAAVAGGTAAQTNRSLRMKGGIMWNGANYLGNITVGVSGVLPVGNANVAGVAVAASAAHNIDLRVQTSTANAANIIRAMVAAIKEI